MASKVYGNRIPTTTSASGRSSSFRRSFQAQPAPLAAEPENAPDPRIQQETAQRQGHNFSRIQGGNGAGIARQPLTGAGGVIQAHSKGKKKKENRQQRQQRGGLNTGDAFDLYGIQGPNRIPHIKGGQGKGGSSRDARHAHGNQVAITGAKNKAIQSGKVTRQDFQSSKKRTNRKEIERKAELKRQKEEEKRDRFLTRTQKKGK